MVLYSVFKSVLVVRGVCKCVLGISQVVRGRARLVRVDPRLPLEDEAVVVTRRRAVEADRAQREARDVGGLPDLRKHGERVSVTRTS